jgi:hypothetical protein
MEEIKFTLLPIKEIKYNPYEILISCSLFKMLNGYKNFDKDYIEPLTKWIYKIPNKAFVRLYVDASVLEEPSFKKLIDMNIPHLEVILYQFDEFLKEDKIHHDGTFGSMVRMLPLYKPYRPKNIKYIWISDIDMPIKVFNYKYIQKMNINNTPILFYSKGCYNKPWAAKKIKYPIGIGRFITKSEINYNFEDFKNFLFDVINGKYSRIYEEIKSYYVEKNNLTQMKTFEHIQYFPYGFDELFVNNFLAEKISTYKRTIIFEISLNEFPDLVLSKNNKKEYIKLFGFSWEQIRPMDKKLKQKLIEYNKEISDGLKALKDDKYKLCIRDFDENYKKIDFYEIGLTAIITTKPNEY